jgi:hypothetical protein
MSSIEQRCIDKRAAIVALARKMVDDGAHYLWGAEGQKPGTNGVVLAPVVLDASKPGQTVFCAARLGTCVCVGRLRSSGINGKVWDPASGGAPADLLQFISDNQAHPDAQVGWVGPALTPRAVTGYADDRSAPSDNHGVSLLNKVVWGEGCDDTQHFDCGGFIRWVAQQVCGSSIKGISTNPGQLNAYGRPMGFEVKTDDTVLPGDIFIYPGPHLAFADTGNGSYKRGANYDIIQAEGGAWGLNRANRGGDTKCIRLSPSTLLGTEYSEDSE